MTELSEAKDHAILEMRKEIDRLKEDRDTLLDAAREAARFLRKMGDGAPGEMPSPALDSLDDAIRKVREE